ncbi:hypothetical protein AFLA_012322 [Aspergillus flavus NRRL3357]|nr:hypothetical protein AFLA_012322 [Aspergillus flavus NRRL3357]
MPFVDGIMITITRANQITTWAVRLETTDSTVEPANSSLVRHSEMSISPRKAGGHVLVMNKAIATLNVGGNFLRSVGRAVCTMLRLLKTLLNLVAH